jgi:hypothetical protein
LRYYSIAKSLSLNCFPLLTHTLTHTTTTHTGDLSCRLGYEGPLCAVCQEDWYLSDGQCLSCAEQRKDGAISPVAGLYLAFAFGVLGLIAWFVYSKLYLREMADLDEEEEEEGEGINNNSMSLQDDNSEKEKENKKRDVASVGSGGGGGYVKEEGDIELGIRTSRPTQAMKEKDKNEKGVEESKLDNRNNNNNNNNNNPPLPPPSKQNSRNSLNAGTAGLMAAGGTAASAAIVG